MGPMSNAMSTPITIALTGLAGVGKDTVADTLVTHAGFSKIAFADALRLEVAAAFRLGDRYGILSDRAGKEQPTQALCLLNCADDDFARCAIDLHFADHPGQTPGYYMLAPRSPRQILQWWGTEYRRAQQPNYWSTKVALRIAEMRQADQERVVVTDCRFPNEAKAIRLMGGELWQVRRPGVTIVEGGHASQTDGNNLGPDLAILNGGDINDLRHSTLRALQQRHGGAVISIT